MPPSVTSESVNEAEPIENPAFVPLKSSISPVAFEKSGELSVIIFASNVAAGVAPESSSEKLSCVAVACNTLPTSSWRLSAERLSVWLSRL